MTAIAATPGREVARPSALLRDVVLMVMARGPCHGYDLARALGDWAPANIAQLYRQLRQLEDGGLAQSKWAESQAGPARRVYSLSARGEDAAAACAGAFDHLDDSLEHYLVRYRALRRRQPGADVAG